VLGLRLAGVCAIIGSPMKIALQAVTESEVRRLEAAVIVAAFAVAARSRQALRDWRIAESLRVLREACAALEAVYLGEISLDLDACAYESGTLGEASRLINAAKSAAWTRR